MEERYETAYNLGCGSRIWNGWINVDLGPKANLKADIRSLPMIPDDSADAVAAIHVLEHFYRWEVEAILTEWRRILKPGGKMILEMPCLDRIAAFIAHCVAEKTSAPDFMVMHALYGDPRYNAPAMCHKWAYSTGSLLALLKSVGMREIKITEPRYHYAFRDMRAEAVK